MRALSARAWRAVTVRRARSRSSRCSSCSRWPPSSIAACAARAIAPSRRPHRPADARGRLVHGVAGARVHGRSRSRSRLPGRVRARRASASAVGASCGALVVVPFVLPTVVVGAAFLAILPDGASSAAMWRRSSSPTSFFNVAVVVRTVGGLLGDLDPRARRRGRDARRVAGGGRCARSTLPLLAPALAARRGDRVPLLVHVVRGRPRPRRPALRDDRGRDLQPGGRALRPPRRGRCSRSCSSLRGRGRAGVATRLRATARRHRRLRAERDTLRSVRTRAASAIVAASLGGLGLFLGLPLAVLVERSLAVGDGYGARRLPGARASRRAFCSRLRGRRRELARRSRRAAAVIAIVVGGLAAFAIADTRGSRLLDLARDAPARARRR